MFMLYFGIVLCFVPLILMLLIMTYKFQKKLSHQLIAVLLGLVAVVPISFLQYFLPGIAMQSIPAIVIIKDYHPILYALLKSILLYGLIEELLKALLILPLPQKDSTPFDFLMLSFVFGISIGCFESVVYYFDHLQLAQLRGAEPLYGIILLRIFSSDIIHMACAGLGGLFIYTACKKNARISFFITAFFLHGIYDFFAGFQNELRWFAIPVILLVLAECRIKYTSLKKDAN